MDAPEGLGDAQQIVTLEEADRRVQLVQQLLEPQLVDLMDHDEQQLVVMRRIAQPLLQREQLGDAQVRTVGQRRGGHGDPFRSRRRGPTAAARSRRSRGAGR
jgi:hypothetical protein